MFKTFCAFSSFLISWIAFSAPQTRSLAGAEFFVSETAQVSSRDEGTAITLNFVTGWMRLNSSELAAKGTASFQKTFVIQTDFANIRLAELTDVLVSKTARGELSVVVIEGQAHVALLGGRLLGKQSEFDVPGGVELLVPAKGLASLAKPDFVAAAAIVEMTPPLDTLLTRVENESRRKPNAADEAELKLEAGDLSGALIASRQMVNEKPSDAKAWHALGKAFRALFVASESEKSFKQALKLDMQLNSASFDLVELYIEQNRFIEAQKVLDTLLPRLPNSGPEASRFLYLSGVVAFRLKNAFEASGQFRRALWDTELPRPMKDSSLDFLQAVSVLRPWKAVAHLGVQYDANALGLAQGQTLPDAFRTRSTFKTVSGGLLNWEQSQAKERGFRLNGAGMQAFYVRNLQRSFSQLDAIMAEGHLDERYDAWRVTESVTGVWVGGKPLSQNFAAIVGRDIYRASLGVERFKASTDSKAGTAVVGFVEATPSRMLSNKLRLDVPIRMDERYAAKKAESDYSQLQFTASPTLACLLTPRLTSQFSLGNNFAIKYQTPRTRTYRLTPALNGSYFATPWLVLGSTAGYEMSWNFPSKERVRRPSVGISATGIF